VNVGHTARGLAFAALAIALAAALVPAGCAGAPRGRKAVPWVFRSPRHGAGAVAQPAAGPRAVPPRAPVHDESAALVVGRIQAAGYHFGTDGSPGALWGYMRTSQRLVDPGEARPGDVVFFDTRTREIDGAPSCADRVGLVEAVEPGGRITFVELRAGQYRRAYVHPRFPVDRRDDGGEVINSFLRAKRIGDADGTRYFAGEMLCGVARIRASPRRN
jgi:hypothetical protein